MRVKILGAGIYGCHIGLSLLREGYDVEVHDNKDEIFSGASGSIPARLHCGALHYPRSAKTSKACISHREEFMRAYGEFTRNIPINIYAVAEKDSLVDFDTYRQLVKSQLEVITIEKPSEYGLNNVEGALLTPERHLLIRELKKYFEYELDGYLCLETRNLSNDYEWIIDCTFCANKNVNVDRYEPCLTTILEGHKGISCTIMDGKFPSIYAWDGDKSLSSMTSAKYTPLAKCKHYDEAKEVINNITSSDIDLQSKKMLKQISYFWETAKDYKIVDNRLSIRAMPRSGSDSRLVEVSKDGNVISIRAGKLDAIIQAEREIKCILESQV